MTLPTTAESLAFADAQPGCTDVQKHLQSLAAAFRDMEKARDHWKANCMNRVEAARLLIQRPDLPIERVAAYQDLIELRKSAAAARWIPVSESLPEGWTDVIIHLSTGNVVWGMRCSGNSWDWADDDDLSDADAAVTHWMPLPAPPAPTPGETTACP